MFLASVGSGIVSIRSAVIYVMGVILDFGSRSGVYDFIAIRNTDRIDGIAPHIPCGGRLEVEQTAECAV